MDTISRYFLEQGNFEKDRIELFFQHDLKDVLNYFYRPESIEEYLVDKKIELINDIKRFIRDVKKLEWRETGEDVKLDEDFLEYHLEFQGNLAKFKRNLAKMSITDLVKYHSLLLNEHCFLNKDREPYY